MNEYNLFVINEMEYSFVLAFFLQINYNVYV